MGRPPSCRRRLLWAWILTWLTGVAAAATALPEARDLAADAQTMREKGQPLVVLFSRGDCHWCEKVRRQHLAPLAAEVSAPLLRQVNAERDTPLIGFAGQASSHRAFTRAQGVKLTPTLMFFGPDGRQLAPPIVGYRLPDFYGAYVDAAIEESRRRLKEGP